MSIRREDKEFIQLLSILGSMLGICIGAFMVMHLSDRAHRRYAQQTEQQQTHAALLKLSSATVTPNNPMANKDVLEQVQQQINPESTHAEPDKGFWLTLPRWKLWALAGGGGLIGAVTGFTAIRMTGLLGSMLIYQFIRLLYAGIRKYAPNSAAAQTLQPEVDKDGALQYQRDNQRILPVVVKLFFFLLLTLILLTCVVWYLTSL